MKGNGSKDTLIEDSLHGKSRHLQLLWDNQIWHTTSAVDTTLRLSNSYFTIITHKRGGSMLTLPHLFCFQWEKKNKNISHGFHIPLK